MKRSSAWYRLGPSRWETMRGFDEEKPQHLVDLNYPYFIGRYPVTVAQWREFLGSLENNREVIRHSEVGTTTRSAS